jgi:hypothetical protein
MPATKAGGVREREREEEEEEGVGRKGNVCGKGTMEKKECPVLILSVPPSFRK